MFCFLYFSRCFHIIVDFSWFFRIVECFFRDLLMFLVNFRVFLVFRDTFAFFRDFLHILVVFFLIVFPFLNVFFVMFHWFRRIFVICYRFLFVFCLPKTLLGAFPSLLMGRQNRIANRFGEDLKQDCTKRALDSRLWVARFRWDSGVRGLGFWGDLGEHISQTRRIWKYNRCEVTPQNSRIPPQSSEFWLGATPQKLRILAQKLRILTWGHPPNAQSPAPKAQNRD